MYNFHHKFTPDENLIRATYNCDVGLMIRSINTGADVNYDGSWALIRMVTSKKCDDKSRKQMINLLLEKGAIWPPGVTTMLDNVLLIADKSLASFVISKIDDPSKEGYALFYALGARDCDSIWKLLNLGVPFSEEVLDLANEFDEPFEVKVSSAYHGLYFVQNLTSSMCPSSYEQYYEIIGLEAAILSSYGICNEAMAQIVG